MVELKDLQKRIYQNKVNHGFNTTDINMEFCYLLEELGEAHVAWQRGNGDLGEELADIAIYLLGLSEILNIDLENEILLKIEKNAKRIYKIENGKMTKQEG